MAKWSLANWKKKQKKAKKPASPSAPITVGIARPVSDSRLKGMSEKEKRTARLKRMREAASRLDSIVANTDLKKKKKKSRKK